MTFDNSCMYWYKEGEIMGGIQTPHSYHSLLNQPNMTYYRVLLFYGTTLWSVLVGDADCDYFTKTHTVIPKDILLHHLLTT